LGVLELILQSPPSDMFLTVDDPNSIFSRLNSTSMLKRLIYDYQLMNFFHHVIYSGFHHLPLFCMSVVKLIPHYEKMPKHQQTFLFRERFNQIHFEGWTRAMIDKYTKHVSWMMKRLMRSRKLRGNTRVTLKHKQHMTLFGIALDELKRSIRLWSYRERTALGLLKGISLQFDSLQEWNRLLLCNRHYFQGRCEAFQELWSFKKSS